MSMPMTRKGVVKELHFVEGAPLQAPARRDRQESGGEGGGMNDPHPWREDEAWTRLEMGLRVGNRWACCDS